MRVNKLLSFLHFNSIKVQLEQGEQKDRAALAQFQFHKGTIRTQYRLQPGAKSEFQFHKGTIRTSMQVRSQTHCFHISIP